MKEKFFKLLKSSNELRKNKRFLEKENPEAFDLLLKDLVRIEENLHYLDKNEYIQLAEDFLSNKIDADNLSYSFRAI
jgi:hypothetical protein